MKIKSIFLVFVISLTLTTNVSAQGFSDLFKNPYPSAAVTSQGQSGGAIAKLAEGCKKMQNALMPFTFLFNLQYQYGFHAHLMAIDMAKAAAGAPPIFTPWFNLAIPGASGTQDDPLIMKICDILIQFDNHGVAKGLFATGDFLNDMTGGKFDAELTLADKLYNASNSVYDLQTGAPRKGALRSAYVHKQLIDAASEAKKYWETKSGNEEPKGLESEAQRRQSLNRVAQLSYQRAILKEATQCPTPTGNTDFQKKYSNTVPERQAKVRNADEDIDFYYRTLLKLGSDMYSNISEHNTYVQSVNQLVHSSVKYRPTTEKYQETDKQVTSKLDKNGKPIKRDRKISKTIYIYTALIDQQFISEFKNKYVKRWENFIKGQLFTSGTTGLFDGKKGRIEEKYRNYAFECSERKLANQISPRDRNDPSYFTNLRKAQSDCRKRLKVRDNDYKNLMDSYIQKLTLALNIKHKNQVEIWNFEARELGYVRVFKDVSSDKNGQEATMKAAQNQEVSCSVDLTPAEMKMIQNKTKAVNIALKEEWAKQEIKETIDQEIEAEGNAKIADKLRKMKAQNDAKRKNNQEGKAGKKVNVEINVRKAF